MAVRAVKGAAAAALAAAFILPTGAMGSVTIGSNLARAPEHSFASAEMFVNTTLPASYQVPAGLASPVNGTVIAWHIRAGTGGTAAFYVVRPLPGGLLTAAGTTPTVPIPPDATTRLALPLPISIGDTIGIGNESFFDGLEFARDDPVTHADLFSPPLQNGAPGRTPEAVVDSEITLNAEIDPTSAFTLGATTRDKKRGTATISATVPNPGVLSATGSGAKVSAVARASTAVTAPGTATLVIRSKGKKRKILNQTGKLKLPLTVAFTPTGGTASFQSTKLKLKKKL
jgi:hypothetical protein